jgi:DHA1 family bicyclomycin/chloramphenicol resistance-like MFS transporter
MTGASVDQRHPAPLPGVGDGLSPRAPRGITGDVVLLLAGLAAIGTLATNIILPAFPRMGTELGLTGAQLGLLLSSFFLTFALGQLVVGPLSDRFGRRSLVLGGLVTFVAGSLVAALAGSFWLLVLGRVIQAMGACAASVLARAIARDLFQGEALGRVLSLTMIAGAVAPGFSPLLGSVLVELSGWRMSFLFVALCAAALAILYLRRVGETHPVGARSELALRSVAGTYRSLVIDRRFLRPALAVSMVLGGLFSFFAAAPGVLMGQLGLTPFQLGLSFAATVLIVFAAGLLAPRLAGRHGSHEVGLFGLIVFAGGSLAMIAVAWQPTYLTFTAAISVVLFGMGLINPLGTAIALQPFGRQAGSASALLGFLQMSSAAIGSTVASVLPFPAATSLAIVMTAAALLALLAFALAFRDRPERVRQAPAVSNAEVATDA